MITGQKVTGTGCGDIGVYGYTHDYLSSLIWVVWFGCVFGSPPCEPIHLLFLGRWLARFILLKFDLIGFRSSAFTGEEEEQHRLPSWPVQSSRRMPVPRFVVWPSWKTLQQYPHP